MTKDNNTKDGCVRLRLHVAETGLDSVNVLLQRRETFVESAPLGCAKCAVDRAPVMEMKRRDVGIGGMEGEGREG